MPENHRSRRADDPSCPNAFIIGAPKCGTTSLAHALHQHPDISVSNPKEPFWFCDDQPRLREQHGLRSFDDYLSLFDPDAPVRIDASTAYLRSDVAVERILETSDEPRFIVMVREPVQVAHAFHMEQVFGLNEPEEDFWRAWELQDERRTNPALVADSPDPEFLQYREVASLGTQLGRAMNQIPEGDLLVIFLDDLRADAAAVYQRVDEFLGVEPCDRLEATAQNPARRHRSALLARMVLQPPAAIERPVRQIRHCLNSTDSAVVERAKSFLRPPTARTALAPEVEAAVRRELASEVAQLEDLTGRDLASWRLGPTGVG